MKPDPRTVATPAPAADESGVAAERLRKVFRNSPAAIGVVRLADGIMLDISDAYERMFGWHRDEVIGSSTEALNIWVHAAERALFRERIAAEGRLTGFLSKARRKDGSEFDSLLSAEIIEENGERLALVIVLDVTERNLAEAAVRESQLRFRALVELSSDWYWMTDADHRFTFLAGAILQRMETPPQGDYGKRPWEVGFLNLDDSAWDEHRSMLRRRAEFRELLVARRGAGGRVYWATLSGRPLYDAQGLFLGYHGTGRDVTHQIEAEQDLHSLNVELERKVAARTAELAAANRELETFSYTASHDLRAPLRGIDGFARLLEEDYGAALGQKGGGYLRRVRAAARRMSELIDGLLAFSRMGRTMLSIDLVDLSGLARSVADELEAGDTMRRVTWRLATGLRARADARLMRIVLQNLLGNAWKYTAMKTDVLIEFESPAPGEFRVRDNGAGFDPAYSDALFQPFRRLHSPDEFEGHGIGLATVKRIIERHGGSISGTGSVGGGASFSFTLPLEPPDAA